MWRLQILFSVFLFCLLPIRAQEDRLEKLLKEKKEYKSSCKTPCLSDSVLVKILDDISWEVKRYNPDSALMISEEELALAQKINWKKGIAKAYTQKGACLKFLGRFNEALSNLNQSVVLWQKIMAEDPQMTNTSKVAIAKALIHEGTIYGEMSKPASSDSAYLEGKRLAHEAGNKKIEAGCLGNLAINYSGRGNFPLALKYNLESLKIFEEMKEERSVFVCFHSIGTLYLNQKQYDKAEEYIVKAMKCAEKLEDQASYADCLNTMAEMRFAQGKYDEALLMRRKSIAINIKTENTYSLCYDYMSMADEYIKLQKFDSSLFYARQALKLSLAMDGNPELRSIRTYEAMSLLMLNKAGEAAKNLPVILDKLDMEEDLILREHVEKFAYTYYRKTGNYKEAMNHYQKLIEVKDSLSNEKNSREQMRTEYQYEYDKRATADSVKVAEEKKVVEAQLKQEKTQRLALYGGLGLVVIFALFMANRLWITSKQKKLIEEQKKIVETQKHIVEEKQNEILESIYYARRIQNALITNEKYIERVLKKHKISGR